MRKMLFPFVSFLLTGCMMPQFHDKTQEIVFQTPKDTVLSIQDYGIYTSPKIAVKREFSSLKGTLSKKGFESKQIEVKSHWTDDKWATYNPGDNKPVTELSAWNLLPPAQTISMTVEGGYTGFKLPFMLSDDNSILPYIASPFTGTYFTVTSFVTGVMYDISNLITLDWPVAVFSNPWYEYDKEIDLSKEILIPTEDFKQQCYSQENKFIGNNDCLSCQIQKVVFSTQDECNRCQNRIWNTGECSLK